MNFRKLTFLLTISFVPFFSQAQTDLKDLAKVLYSKKAYQSSNMVPADSVFEMQFIKYIKLENLDLEGVHIINDLKLVVDPGAPDSISLSRGLFKINKGKIFRVNYTAENVQPIDKVGYYFLVKGRLNQENLDTLVAYNANSGILAYRKSDYLSRASNVIADEKLKLQEDNDQTYLALKDAIKGFEKNLFPQDSLYAIGVKYKLISDNGDLNRNISEKHNLFHTTFFLSSNTNIIQLQSKLKSVNTVAAWRPDSLWLIKRFSVKDLCSLKEITSFYSSREEYISYDTDYALEDVKKNKSRVKVYTDLDLLKFELPDALIDRSTFAIRLMVNQGTVYLYIGEHILGERVNDSDETKKEPFSSYNYSIIPLFKKLDEPFVNLMGIKTDIRIDEPTYFELININFNSLNEGRLLNYDSINFGFLFNAIRKNGNYDYPFSRISKYGYNLDKNELKKKMVFSSWVGYYQKLQSLKQEAEEAAEKEKLINQYAPKYGKNFVQQAFDGNILIGMHEDLLPIPLKLWKIYKRTDFTGGYTLYLTSLLNSAKRLQVRVSNKKVSYVSSW